MCDEIQTDTQNEVQHENQRIASLTIDSMCKKSKSKQPVSESL